MDFGFSFYVVTSFSGLLRSYLDTIVYKLFIFHFVQLH